jgi:hypothetical protein
MAILRPNLTRAIVEGEDVSRASAASSMDHDTPSQGFSDGGVVPGRKIPESRSKASLPFLPPHPDERNIDAAESEKTRKPVRMNRVDGTNIPLHRVGENAASGRPTCGCGRTTHHLGGAGPINCAVAVVISDGVQQ